MAKKLSDLQVRRSIIHFLSVTKKHQYYNTEKYRYISASASEIAKAVKVSKKRAENILEGLSDEFLVYAKIGKRWTMKYKWADEKEKARMIEHQKFSERFDRLKAAANNIGFDVGNSGDISMSLDTFEMLLTAYEKSR
jgi:hypothetical protein